jgi:leukotriene-A4 hydrolase
MNYGVNNTFSSLYPKMNGRNPDDSYSQLPYEKGFQFLVYLESLLPSEDDFETLIS